MQGKEFIRIGYYVNNEYTDEQLKENPPEVPQIDKLSRSVLADHPRVTRFPNDFDSPPEPVGGGAGLLGPMQPAQFACCQRLGCPGLLVKHTQGG